MSQEALRRLEAADPVPSPRAMPSAAWSSVVLLDRIDERSGHTTTRPTIERLRPPLQTGRGRGPLIAIATAAVVLVIGAATAILTLSGGGGNEVFTPSPTTTVGIQPLQPGPITSFEDIAGTYLRHGVGPPTYYLFFEDGTIHASTDRNLIVDRPQAVFETSLAGTKVFMTQSSSPCNFNQPDRGGTYEIHVLGSGNLEFVAVDEDTCAYRSGNLLGLRDGVATAEYERVP